MEKLVPAKERFESYSKGHCWQYEVKLQARREDSQNLVRRPQGLTIKDLEFFHVEPSDRAGCLEVKKFIERYEWLGTTHVYSTHRFVARCKKTGELAASVVLATPNSFSPRIFGKDYSRLEKLISRGASSHWAPKNIGSWFIMKAIRWMVSETEFRIFSGYSDPSAKELGTIYQACNFYYLGNSFGTAKQYYDPSRPDKGWFSDRAFYYRSEYVRAARRLGIFWDSKKYYKLGTSKIDWLAVPILEAQRIKQEVRRLKLTCLSRSVPRKHRYVYLLEEGARKTKHLRETFLSRIGSQKELVFHYPKDRSRCEFEK